MRTKSTYLALLAVLLSPMAANAVPIVLTDLCQNDSSLNCVTGFEDVDIGGSLYDIDLILTSFDDFLAGPTPEYFGDYSGALLAAQVVAGLLDGQSIYGPIGTSPNASVDAILIPWQVASDTSYSVVCAYNGSNSDSWGPATCGGDPSATYDSSFYWAYARFNAVSVPEPGTLALLGIGLLGIAASRRRKKV